MIGGKGIIKQRRIFSLMSSVILLVSILLIGISIEVPEVSASAVDHNVGELDINALTDYGRILAPLTWGQTQSINDPSTGSGFIGLVIDQDNYNHAPGSEDIADSFSNHPYMGGDDFTMVSPINMIIDDGVMQKSIATFQNTGTGTGDPNDILINQTAWTVKNKDWAILQWSLFNLKGVAINNVCFGLELPLSQMGAGLWSGVGGDSGDDIDGFDSVNNVYWAQDNGGTGTCIGFGSAIASDPITHYYSEDHHPANYDTYKVFWEDDAWLYNRIHAGNSTVGATPGNRTSTVGWNNVTMNFGSSRIFTLVIAINDTFANMITALKDAQYYYHNKATGFRITEFSDDQSGATPQRIEVYSDGRPPTNLITEGYFLSKDGTTPLPGNWVPDDIIPTFGYRVFEVTGTPIGPEGDTIGLYQDLGGGDIVLAGGPFSYGQEGIIPDPLDGESVARRFDAASANYTNEWLRNASTGPTWGAQNDVLAINTLSYIVLNEVMFNPCIGPDGRYIVIFNNQGFGIVISNYYIICDDFYRLPAIPPLQPHSMLIINYTSAPTLFQNMDSGKDNVYLYDNNGRLLDMVGWNSPHTKGMSVRRSPDGNGTLQGYNDITSEAAGWVFNSPLQVLMTEISDGESSPSQIEIYNPWYPPIDFSANFTFSSNSHNPLSGVWNIPTAGSGEYALFDVAATTPLSPEGDTIISYQNNILIEQIGYGQKGIVPDPLAGESVQRYWDGSAYRNVWERNFTTDTTFGSQNEVPPPNLGSAVLINEIMFNPITPVNGFVELYLKHGDLNISSYKIVGDSEYIIPEGIELTPDNRFYYLMFYDDPDFFTALNPSGDNVYLYDNNGSLLDMAGWSSSHTKGKTMCRIPNGDGTRYGFDDTSSIAAGWVFDCTPTVQFIKVSTEDDIKYGNFTEVLYFELTITNKQSVDDTVLIFIVTLYGFPVAILDETGTFIITEIFVPAESQVNITVMVILTSEPIFIEWDNITITIQSQNKTLFRDITILQALVYPFISPEKFAFPQEIYLNGTGHDEISNITLSLAGLGPIIELYEGQDVIFCVDTSRSMSNESIDLIKEGLFCYVENMSVPDQGAIVVFGGIAILLNGLTSDYKNLTDAIGYIPDPSGGTPMGEALSIAIDELLLNGRKSNFQVIILLTDGGWNGVVDPEVPANIAAANNITIFTIGLGTSVDEATLKKIMNITGGMYFYAKDPSSIPEIYKLISTYIKGYIAGKDPDIYDAVPMVRDVLPPWIEFIEGSFSKRPDTNYVNETGYRILEWNISAILIGTVWEVTFQVKSNKAGWVRANDLNSSRIYYRNFCRNDVFVLFPECLLHVLGPPPPQPTLYINVSQDGQDVILYWDPPQIPGIEYYLIYRSKSQTDFDFNTIWINTSADKELGEPSPIPLRTMWNDTKAAFPGNETNYEEQYYYVIRAVNDDGEMSRTSRTVGKWTKIFLQGISTFSLPLEPLQTMNKSVDYYLKDMNAGYIKWMHPGLHKWMKHGDDGVNNTYMKVGEGYEVRFDSQSTYTFTGMPGAMISYDDDNGFLGFDPATEARNLTVSVEPGGNVTLAWEEPSSMGVGDWYEVYYSNERDGFFKTLGVNYSFVCPPVYFGNNTASHEGAKANDPDARLYYMVVPFNASGVRGASTYSLGIWTEEYLSQYDTIGIPLKLSSNQTADWYCNNINNTVGINYFNCSAQRWCWHYTRMPGGTYDPILRMTEGYQISTSQATKYTFIGI